MIVHVWKDVTNVTEVLAGGYNVRNPLLLSVPCATALTVLTVLNALDARDALDALDALNALYHFAWAVELIYFHFLYFL